MTKTVLFDLDGTLLDTAPDFVHIVNDMRAQRQLAPIKREEFIPQIARGSAAMTQYGFNLTEADADYPATLEEFYQQYMEGMGRYAKPFPGVMELLQHLDDQHIKWGVVTNRKLAFIPKILQQFDLHDRCHCIVGSDSTPYRKPHPGSLLHAAELLHVNPQECFYVGDFPTDIDAAQAAGMISIAVTWGYHDGLATLRDAKPDYLFNTPAEILTLLNAQ